LNLHDKITFSISHFKFSVIGTTVAGPMDDFFFPFWGALDAHHCLFPGLSTGSIRVGLFGLCDRYEVHFAAIPSCCADD
jgi:hypothetical protein